MPQSTKREKGDGAYKSVFTLWELTSLSYLRGAAELQART